MSPETMTGMTVRPQGPLRLVLDTSVYVTAVLSARSDGHCRQLLEAAAADEITVIVSPSLLAELRGVLGRDKFRRWIPLSEVDPFVWSVAAVAEQRPDSDVIPAVDRACQDPGDRYLVALARSGDAHYLVSTDRDLTEMNHPQVLVRTPTEIAQMLAQPAELGSGAAADPRTEEE